MKRQGCYIILLVFTALMLYGVSCNKKPATYHNPIIHADYSDPDVIRVGDDFYMVSSSFAHTPGLPILHSKDLVQWTIIGHAIENLPNPIFKKPQHGKGVWAPSIRYHEGEFRIYYGDPDFGIFMVRAKNPKGPWEEPILVKAGKGRIDPCPFWDDDGRAYLIHAWAKSRAGFNSILTLCRLNEAGTRIIDEGATIFDGHADHPTIEGPKLYKRNGWQTVLRSKNIYGPYEAKSVLEQGSTAINGPHQGAWIETNSGESWFVHFQDRGAYGRIVHLQPMQWRDDWPLLGTNLDGNGIGEPVTNFRKPDLKSSGPEIAIQTSDDFNDRKLGLQWQWQANFETDWYSLSEHEGWLRLWAVNPLTESRNLWYRPNIIAQKFPAEAFEVLTQISFHPEKAEDRAGLVIIGRNYAALALSKAGSQYRLTQIECQGADRNNPDEIVESVTLDQADVFLKVCISKNARCRFSYSTGGRHFTSIGNEFRAVEGRWVGAKLGLFSITAPGTKSQGYADFNFFTIDKLKS